MAKIRVEDLGDPTVGIMPKTYELDTPFEKGDMTDDDVEDFRESVEMLYAQYAEGKLIAKFDWEL